MFEKIKEIVNRFKWWHSYASCYTERENEGYAIFEMCGGDVGGTRATEYLSERCIDCPYYAGKYTGYRKEIDIL